MQRQRVVRGCYRNDTGGASGPFLRSQPYAVHSPTGARERGAPHTEGGEGLRLVSFFGEAGAGVFHGTALRAAEGGGGFAPTPPRKAKMMGRRVRRDSTANSCLSARSQNFGGTSTKIRGQLGRKYGRYLRHATHNYSKLAHTLHLFSTSLLDVSRQ